ncbi:DUF5979 domain-containing protein [Leifsonia sp. NPDC077715]|uniref:DUF5979 domain-containing protein n=1 Tax=Leifsonia sp. NPDC077715 TaxID=3155539 RepID=UPI00342CF207
MAPILAVGVVFGGAALPASADDTATTTAAAGGAPATSGSAGVTPGPAPTAAAPDPVPNVPDSAAPTVSAPTPTAPTPSAPTVSAPAAPPAHQPAAEPFSPQTDAVQTLAAGDPVLTITKTVVNTGGGTATPSSWTYLLTGKRSNGNDTSPASSSTFQSGVPQTVTATATTGNGASALRSYAITESGGPANYTLTGIVCTGATANGTFASGALSGLQLHSGDTAACTITNTYTPPPMATIVVRAGGQRTGATTVGSLPNGAVYQAVPTAGGAAVSCTIAAGQCSLTVPAGSAYDISAQGAAPGYFLNPTLDVGSSSAGAPTSYDFRTGTLAANSTTTVPGTDANSVYTDANGNRFSGLFAQSLLNPGVQQMCGLRIALVLDQSGSMGGAKQTTLKSAANDVVTALTGTPSSLAIYTFAATAGTSLGVTSTATAASAQPLHDFIGNLPAPASYTNWDRGLGQVGSGFDLVILLTDGNPTTYGDGSADGSNARLAYVEQGIFSANRIKGALGERLVAIGVGVDGGTENLRAVSGPTAGSDYFPESETGFGATLTSLATGACSNVVTIQKRIEDTAGNVLDNSPAANGWSYTGTTSSGTLGSFSDTTTQNGNTGFTSASISVAPGTSPTVALTEAPKPGYTLDRAKSTCLVNGQTVTVGGSGTTLSFTGSANVPISCTFVNRIVQTYGTVSVTKYVTGDGAQAAAGASFTVHYAYPAGSGYAAGSGDLTVTDGSTAMSPSIPTGAVVTLTEPTRPVVTGATWGSPAFTPSSSVTIGNGTNVAVSLENPITLDMASFTVQKSVIGTGAGAIPNSAPFTVTWSYPAKPGVYPAANGSVTVTTGGGASAPVAVPVGAVVTLGEAAPGAVPGVTWGPVGVFSPSSPITAGAKGSTVTVTVTNTATLNTGRFSVTKAITGDTALVPVGTPFTVHYTYPAGSGYAAGQGDVTAASGSAAVTSSPIPEGAVVHLTETDLPSIPNGTWGTPSFSVNDVMIGNGTTVAVTLTNPITHDTGSFDLRKVVIGSAASLVAADAQFTVHYQWDAAADGSFPAGSGFLVVKNDGVVVDGPAVPVGASVVLGEQPSAPVPGATLSDVSFSPDSPVTITGKDATIHILVTNTYTLNTGAFSIVKHVTGSGAYLIPPATVYTVHYQYTGGIAGQPGSGTLGLLNGIPQVVSGLPEGAVVTFAEDAPAPVTGATWGAATIQPHPPIIAADGTVAVTVTNPVTEIAPTLQLEKVVTGGIVPASEWILTGTGDDGSPTVTNSAGGGTEPVAVTTGAAYALSEAPSPDFDAAAEFSPGDWSCVDSHGGTVSVTQGDPGDATLRGLAAGQAVVCTITNTHRDQGVTIGKALADPATQNADGTWTIIYTVDVANRSAVAATTYTLSDTLHYGGGITVNSARWTGPTAGDFAGASAVLATGHPLSAGETDRYTVTVNATVTAAAWDDRTTACPDRQGAGGFLNTATVLSADRTGTSSACDAPGSLTMTKVPDGVPVLDAASGHYAVSYTITVGNASSKPQFYDLTDAPAFAAGVEIVDSSATKNGDPIPFDGTHLATASQLAAGTVDTYSVRYTVRVNGLDVGQAHCDGRGTGLFNTATLSTGTVPAESSGCADVPTGTITLAKAVAAGFGGTEPSGSWALTATGVSGHTVTGSYTAGRPNSAITEVTVPTGAYALSEGPAIPGYALTQLTCADAAGAPVGIIDGVFDLRPGQDVTCTFTNTPQPAHLTLVKDVEDPDHSGTAKTPHDWTLTATPEFAGLQAVSGRGDPNLADGVDAVPVWAGSYDLTESGPSGFEPGDWSCEGANVVGGVVTIPLGADVTCTISNTAELPHLTLVKTVDNGATNGSGVPSDWIVSAAGPTHVSGAGSDDPGDPNPAITDIGVAVGDYTLSEDGSGAPAGYVWSALACVARNGDTVTALTTSVDDPTLHLSEGDDVTCTFTNSAIPASWTLSKTSDRGLSVMPGDVITYTLTLAHTGGVYPKLLSLLNVDDLSGVIDHATFVPGSLFASDGTAAVTGGRLNWTLVNPTLASFALTYQFRVDPNAWGVSIRNALTPPQNVSCVGDNDCVTESDTPDLELWKTSEVTAQPDPDDATEVLPGGQVTYTLHAHNPTAIDLPAGQTETDDLTGVIGHAVVGSLGAGLTFDGEHTLTWTLPAVPAGGSADVSFVATVTKDRGGYALTNVLVPDTGHCLAPSEENPADCTTTNRVPFIDLGLVKTSSTQGPVDDDPGSSSTYAYTLTVTNNSDEAVAAATVTDPLPPQITVDSAQGTNGFDQIPAGWTPTYDPVTNTVTIGIPSMAFAESAAIRVHVLVKPVVDGSVGVPVNPVDPGQPGPAPITPPDTIDNTACVALAGDTVPDNDCSTSSVQQNAVEANIYVQCQADIPSLHYAIRTTSGISDEPVTVKWIPSHPGDNGVPSTDLPPDPAGLTRTLHDGDTGSILWPGGAVDGEGVGIGFPGWRPIEAGDYDSDGTLRFPASSVFAGLVYDPATVASDAWRYPSTVTISVNPTAVYTVTYPPATTACAVARTTAVGFTKTASAQVVPPGGTFTYTLQAHDLGLGAANPVTISDPIPADIRVDTITTDQTAFPRWQDCAVSGERDGFGGTLNCSLFGPISQAAPNTPAITLGVTLRPSTAAASIVNTATLCFADMDDPRQTGCESSTATIYTSRVALLAATGSTLWWVSGAATAILLAGLGTVVLGIRRRRVG